ncbi:MAG: AzlD domain-containing protein [Rhizobiaceae bacterium]|nr:AzlD domain-containing protein [Rhizobiaceae bacterium]
MILGAVDAWWWPYAFILIAGWATTYPWRFLGVFIGGRIREDAEILVFVRALATALVAGVIGNFVCYPSGPAAEASLLLRIGAMAAGFATYLLWRRSVLAGLLVGEAVFCLGLYFGG